jgi:tape measure domain-containing protein
MTDFATLVLAADTRQMTQAERAIDGVTKAGDRAEKATGALGRGIDDASKKTKAFSGNLNGLKTALAAVTSALAVKELINYTNTWTDLQSRVGLAVQDMTAAPAVLDRISQMARRTFSSLDQTAEAFLRNAIGLRELGLSTNRSLDFVEALNNALVVSGAKAQQAESAQNALSNALALGTLSGQNLNTILTSGGRVAELLAQSLGTTTLGLRQMGADGKITGDVIINSLVGNLDLLRQEADSMPATIGDAMTLINNALLTTVGSFDQMLGASSAVANILILLADNMDRAVVMLGTAAAAFVVYRGAVIAAQIATIGLSGALVVARAALLRLGLGIIIVAAGELAFRISKLIESTGGWGNALSLLGEVASGVWTGITTSASAILPGLASVWQSLRGDFLLLTSDLAQYWADFLGRMANALEGVPVFKALEEGLRNASTNVTRASGDIAASAIDAAQQSEKLAETARNNLTSGFQIARDALSRLNTTVEQNIENTEDGTDAANALASALDNVSDGAGGAGAAVKGLNDDLQQTPQWVTGVSDAFADLVMRGFKDFGSFAQSVVNTFRNMLRDMIAMAARNRIMISLGMGGGVPGTAANAGTGMLGSMGGGAGISGMAGGTGFMGGMGNALGGGLGNVLNIGANAAAAGGGIMATMGAALPVVGAVVGIVSLFAGAAARRAQKRLEAATNANNAALQRVEQENSDRNAELAARLRANVDATQSLIQSMQTLAQMEQEREQAARAILAERANLEIELLRLQNDTVALREREIAATEPVNRQLRRFILAMGDAASAIEAQRRAVEGLASAGGGVVDFVRGIRNQAALSFREDLALAQGGDIAASGRITGSAQSAIDQARAGARTGVELDRFIAQTAASLMALPAVATFEEQQIALLEEISSGIGDLTSLQDDTQRKLIKAIGDGFFVIDKNLDGKLTFDELKAGLGGIATDAELRQIFNTLDKNGDGTIDRLEYLTNSNDGIEDNTGEAWLASQNQLSELKIIAGETANNTLRVMELTEAIETLVFSQKVASQQQLANLEAQRTAARRTLENAQRALSGTPSTVVLQSAKKGFLGIGRRPEIRGANPTYVALQEDIRRATEELAALEAQINNIPRYAAGGAHMGGVRMVGERGPELEVTGPSQIHSNASTMEMLSNAPVVSELKNLRRELAAMRDEQRQLGIQTARNTERTYRVLREFDVIGLPPERTT